MLDGRHDVIIIITQPRDVPYNLRNIKEFDEAHIFLLREDEASLLPTSEDGNDDKVLMEMLCNLDLLM